MEFYEMIYSFENSIECVLYRITPELILQINEIFSN